MIISCRSAFSPRILSSSLFRDFTDCLRYSASFLSCSWFPLFYLISSSSTANIFSFLILSCSNYSFCCKSFSFSLATSLSSSWICLPAFSKEAYKSLIVYSYSSCWDSNSYFSFYWPVSKLLYCCCSFSCCVCKLLSCSPRPSTFLCKFCYSDFLF